MKELYRHLIPSLGLFAIAMSVSAVPIVLGDRIPIATGDENVMAAANFNHDLGNSSDLTLIIRVDVNGKTVVDEKHPVKYAISIGGKEKLGKDWIEREFDDSAWDDGEQSVGYGDPDDWTVIPNGTNAAFTRFRFEIDNAASVKTMTLFVDWDDFYFISINGVEVARDSGLNAGIPQPDIPRGDENIGGGHGSSELPKGSPNKNRWAHAKIDQIEVTKFEVFSLDVGAQGKLAMTWADLKR